MESCRGETLNVAPQRQQKNKIGNNEPGVYGDADEMRSLGVYSKCYSCHQSQFYAISAM